MNVRKLSFIIFIPCFLIFNCKDNEKEIVKGKKEIPVMMHFVDDELKNCDCPVQFELADSNKMVHSKNQFYKGGNGHLYQKTEGLKEIEGELKSITYFNGYISQRIDPETFEVLDGWYGRDKTNVYYYRPVSGGIQIIDMTLADRNTFKILDGQYNYAMDKNYFFSAASIIKKFKPSETFFEKDNKGKIMLLKNKSSQYKLD